MSYSKAIENRDMHEKSKNILEQWKKNSPTLQDVFQHATEVHEGNNEDFTDLSDRFQELTKIKNFLLTHHEIKTDIDSDKLDVLMAISYYISDIREMIFINIQENPFIPDEEKRKLFEKYNESKEAITDSMNNKKK